MDGRSFLSGEHDTVITTIIRAPQPLQTCFGGEQASMCLERVQCSSWQLKVFARYKGLILI